MANLLLKLLIILNKLLDSFRLFSIYYKKIILIKFKSYKNELYNGRRVSIAFNSDAAKTYSWAAVLFSDYFKLYIPLIWTNSKKKDLTVRASILTISLENICLEGIALREWYGDITKDNGRWSRNYGMKSRNVNDGWMVTICLEEIYITIY